MSLISLSQIRGGNKIANDLAALQETSFIVYKETITVTKYQQTEFLLNLTNVTEYDISPNYPAKLNVNGIVYYEPDFYIDIANKKLTWITTRDEDGFDLDTKDTVVLEIPLKKKDEEES
jgi:hypothetical protein